MKKKHRNLSAQQLADCYNTTGSTLGWKPLNTEEIIQANERLRDAIVSRYQKNFEVLNQIEININQYGIQNDNPLPSYHKNLEKPTPNGLKFYRLKIKFYLKYAIFVSRCNRYCFT